MEGLHRWVQALLFKNSSFNYISGWRIMDKNAL
jgi:hypothetical protein